MTFQIILFVAAFVLFVLAGLRVGEGRVSLGWLGAACFSLGVILSGVGLK